MPPRVTEVQRQAILEMLASGLDRKAIAYQVGVTPGQVSAVSAHVTMGTYQPQAQSPADGIAAALESVAPRLDAALDPVRTSGVKAANSAVFVGWDSESGDEVVWNPDPGSGAANPHVLVLGESGYGKTYAISALLCELAEQEKVAIVFDYGQGFSVDSAPPEFVERTRPVEIHANRDGVAINPLQVFSTDLHGPVNVAQRIADTFGRIYDKIGVQQHAVLRQAVLNTMTASGIVPDDPATWRIAPPPFASVEQELQRLAEATGTPQGRTAASVASHISTVFIYNTFRPSGQKLAWREMLEAHGRVFVIQLRGLEHSLERAVTEFLLWNLIGFIESLGPAPLRCFIVLDEAHRLSFDPSSPVEKLLREGRKFGVGLILASQQPEDFSPVAFGNTATKLVFQVADENSVVSRQIHRKMKNSHSYPEIASLITKLPRGTAYLASENRGRVVKISSFHERLGRWSKRP